MTTSLLLAIVSLSGIGIYLTRRDRSKASTVSRDWLHARAVNELRAGWEGPRWRLKNEPPPKDGDTPSEKAA